MGIGEDGEIGDERRGEKMEIDGRTSTKRLLNSDSIFSDYDNIPEPYAGKWINKNLPVLFDRTKVLPLFLFIFSCLELNS